jgi:hypothetical protein
LEHHDADSQNDSHICNIEDASSKVISKADVQEVDHGTVHNAIPQI